MKQIQISINKILIAVAIISPIMLVPTGHALAGGAAVSERVKPILKLDHALPQNLTSLSGDRANPFLASRPTYMDTDYKPYQGHSRFSQFEKMGLVQSSAVAAVFVLKSYIGSRCVETKNPHKRCHIDLDFKLSGDDLYSVLSVMKKTLRSYGATTLSDIENNPAQLQGLREAAIIEIVRSRTENFAPGKTEYVELSRALERIAARDLDKLIEEGVLSSSLTEESILALQQQQNLRRSSLSAMRAASQSADLSSR